MPFAPATMPKITHVTSAHLCWDTRIYWKECLSLAAAGYEVTLVAPAIEKPAEDVVKLIALRPRQRAVRITFVAAQAVFAALKTRADLYHLHDPELLLAGKLMHLLGKRVIFDMHKNFPRDMTTKPWLPRRLRPVLAALARAVERVLLAGIPVVFAENSYVQDYRYLRRHVVVLNMPRIDHLLAIHEPKHSRPCVGYVGAANAPHGVLIMVEALQVLKQRGREVGWYCVGEMEAGLQRSVGHRIASYHLNDVHLLGGLPPLKAMPIMARCHIGLALLEPLPNLIESYPTKMFEYMALGLPVVASDFPLYRDVVERHECGICVDPRDPASVADAVEQILDDPDRARAMGEAGRRAVAEHYNWSSEAEKLLGFYRDCLDSQAVTAS